MKEFDELVQIVERLKDKEKGCPWDIKQTLTSLIPNFVEEVYELIEAIETKDVENLKEEIGDVFLHLIFQTQIAKEKNWFHLNEVLQKINQKLIFRHPHVFGNISAKDANKVKQNWEKLKQKEKKESRNSILDGIPKNMPSLIIASRIQEKAASVGFDWLKNEEVISKIEEELDELKEAIAEANQKNIEEEFGDLLFAITNLARKLELDAENVLRLAAKKFENRFHQIEKHYKDNQKNIQDANLEELNILWEKIKNKKGLA